MQSVMIIRTLDFMADGDVTCHTVSHLCPSVTRHADMSRVSRSGPSLFHVSINIMLGIVTKAAIMCKYLT